MVTYNKCPNVLQFKLSKIDLSNIDYSTLKNISIRILEIMTTNNILLVNIKSKQTFAFLTNYYIYIH